MATLEQLQATITRYEAARDRILTSGQSYTVDGVTYTSASLDALEKRISELEFRIAAASGQSTTTVPVFRGRG